MRGFRVADCLRLNYVIAILTVAFLAVLAIMPGCGNREAQRKPAEQPVRIAFALADINRDGNKTIKKVVDQQKEQLNAEVTWLDARNDPARQQKQLDELAGKQIKAVVLQPVDPATASGLVEKLARSGIKVVALENLPLNTPVEGYIASDHAMVGRLQARFVQEALARAAEAQSGKFTPPRAGTIIRPGDEQSGASRDGQLPSQGGSEQAGGQQQGAGQAAGGGRQGESGQQGGTGGSQGSGGGQGQVTGAVDYSVVAQLPRHRPLNVVILQGDPKDQLARDITAANQAALQGQKDVKVVKVYEHPRWDPSTVAAGLAEVMEKEDRIDVILANDSTLAMAAVEFLKMGGMDKNVLTVGVGADEMASRGVVSGEHDAEVDLQPEMLGRFALEAAVGLAKNGYWQYGDKVNNGDYSVPARIVPVRLVTARNAYLLEERWEELKKAREQGGGGQQQSQAGRQGGGQEQSSVQSQPGEQSKQDRGGQQGGGQGKTTLRITTQDGKTMEVQIDGEVKKIESVGQQGGHGDGQGMGDGDQGGG
ncbi:substrate-binding domain-containing protein [Desulfallas thermosapovorans]|uniref:Substrate-binding family protein n=1 Tax=Desulfallas thermosapovorans DSM 6562 TaxID=1121431 RepID=A0A5S4ZQ20_9FIRM|nr:substrate-binding domain-containing protein [Desulfallas thermosapovorans]TYO94828.1 substrate-binding family protein [Desulfallas thermosapovorans DSM 6562]